MVRGRDEHEANRYGSGPGANKVTDDQGPSGPAGAEEAGTPGRIG